MDIALASRYVRTKTNHFSACGTWRLVERITDRPPPKGRGRAAMVARRDRVPSPLEIKSNWAHQR